MRFVVYGAGAIGGLVGALLHEHRGDDEVVLIARGKHAEAIRTSGLVVASAAEDEQRRAGKLDIRPVEGRMRGGGSGWQSLQRGAGSVESDYLNGEIVLLGRMYGVPTPVNALLQQLAREMARQSAAQVL